MKSKSFVVTPLIGFLMLFTSCSHFKDEEPVVSNPMIGNRKLDSIATEKDTSFATMLTLIALHGHPGGITFRVTDNIIYTASGIDTDTTAYSFDLKQNHFVGKDDQEEPFYYNQVTPFLSTLTFNNDNVFFIIRK